MTGIDLLNHLMPLFGIATGVLISVTITHRRAEARNATDASRLRTALQVELAMLRAVYEDNLELLDAGGEFLPSSRQLTSLYRANLGRIQLLNQAEIPLLVTAYGYNEVVESYLGATCKPVGQAYRVLAGEAPVEAIRQRFRAGQAHIAAALEALNEAPGARATVASRVMQPQDADMASQSSVADQIAPA